jgi:hypothetical protein
MAYEFNLVQVIHVLDLGLKINIKKEGVCGKKQVKSPLVPGFKFLRPNTLVTRQFTLVF